MALSAGPQLRPHHDEDQAGQPPPSPTEVVALRAEGQAKGELLQHVSVSPLHKAFPLNAVRITQSRRERNIGQRGERSLAYVTAVGGGWACLLPVASHLMLEQPI